MAEMPDWFPRELAIAQLQDSKAKRKWFAFSLWKYRYVVRIMRGPFRSFVLEIERGPKRWY